MRQGSYSREQILLLRFEWKGDSVACDWMMRSPDPWDRGLDENVVKDNETLQALADAINLCEAIFKAFPAVTIVAVQGFRSDSDHRLELVISGNVNRDNELFPRIASTVMRARMCGFEFNLEDGRLGSLMPTH